MGLKMLSSIETQLFLYFQIIQTNVSSDVSLISKKIEQKIMNITLFNLYVPPLLRQFKKVDKNNNFSISTIFLSFTNLIYYQIQVDPKMFNITVQTSSINTISTNDYFTNLYHNIQQKAMPNGECFLIRAVNKNKSGHYDDSIIVFEIYNNNCTKQKNKAFQTNYSFYDQLTGEFLEDELFLISRIVNITDESTQKNHSAIFFDFYKINLIDFGYNFQLFQTSFHVF